MHYQSLVNPLAMLNKLTQLIDSCDSIISITSFFWRDGYASDVILHHLEKAVKRGVRIDVVLDSVVYLTANSKQLANFASTYKDKVKVYLYIGQGFLHSKLWIFDSNALCISSCNISDQYYTTLHRKKFMTNREVYIENASTALLAEAHCTMMDYIRCSKLLKTNDNVFVDRVNKTFMEHVANFEINDGIVHIDESRVKLITSNKIQYDTLKSMFNEGKNIHLEAGYINYHIVNKLSNDKNEITVVTSDKRGLSFIDWMYETFNRLIPLRNCYHYYSSVHKVHSKVYHNEKMTIYGSYNIDYLSKINREVMLVIYQDK